mmetsp:Transcript_128054/g.221246  ORF Transcript_128054/g.221246 Transcript_128054/m.221246 type:complete len:239 (-) Transcript_128054:99-815(-)
MSETTRLILSPPLSPLPLLPLHHGGPAKSKALSCTSLVAALVIGCLAGALVISARDRAAPTTCHPLPTLSLRAAHPPAVHRQPGRQAAAGPLRPKAALTLRDGDRVTGSARPARAGRRAAVGDPAVMDGATSGPRSPISQHHALVLCGALVGTGLVVLGHYIYRQWLCQPSDRMYVWYSGSQSTSRSRSYSQSLCQSFTHSLIDSDTGHSEGTTLRTDTPPPPPFPLPSSWDPPGQPA